MTKPMPLAEFIRLPPLLRAEWRPGLSAAIDTVADGAPETHRFLRYAWYAAAVAAYGGHPRTLVIEREDTPLIALPVVGLGPGWLKAATVPGCYWPFRGFPVHREAGEEAFAMLAAGLARRVRVLRLGPIADDDAVLQALLPPLRARGWLAISRRVGTIHRMPLAALHQTGAWPRGSSVRKNRFHEKHLAAHGELAWRTLGAGDWPAAFDALAAVERRSWILQRTDGRDAKFADTAHGRFWRHASADPAIARRLQAALLTIDGQPAAFSFDLDAGALRHAIANSYDPAFAKHSPGKLLQYRNLQQALARGVEVVDWGVGDPGYKATLGAEEGPEQRDWLLLAPRLPALAGRLIEGWWRRSGA